MYFSLIKNRDRTLIKKWEEYSNGQIFKDFKCSNNMERCEDNLSDEIENITRTFGETPVFNCKYAKGHYETVDIVNIFKNCNNEIKNKKIITKNEENISCYFNKSNIKFSIYNNTSLTLFISNSLKNFMELPSNLIKKNSIMYSNKHFTNMNTRCVIVTFDNIIRGKKFDKTSGTDNEAVINNSQIIFSSYINSKYGYTERFEIKNPKYYDYLYSGDNKLRFSIEIVDECGNLIKYTNNENFYITLSIL